MAWEIYSRCGAQVITAGMTGTILGLNILAVYRVMESFFVSKEDELQILDKILTLHSVYFPLKEGDK